MIIYLDVVFIENLIINFFLLFLTNKVIKNKFVFLRIFIAAIIATSYTIVAIVFPIPIYKSFILKFLLSIVLCQISFDLKNKIDLLKSVLIFYLITFILGGMIYSEMRKIPNIISILTIIITANFLLAIIYKIIKDKIIKNKYICEVLIKIDEEQVKTKALIDTGNELKDNITDEDVIILQSDLIKSKEIKDILYNYTFDIPIRYHTKIRMINYKTFNESGIKTGIKIDEIIIKYDNQTIKNEKAVIILTENTMKNYGAIISFNLIEGGYIYGNNDAYKIKSKEIIY